MSELAEAANDGFLDFEGIGHQCGEGIGTGRCFCFEYTEVMPQLKPFMDASVLSLV